MFVLFAGRRSALNSIAFAVLTLLTASIATGPAWSQDAQPADAPDTNTSDANPDATSDAADEPSDLPEVEVTTPADSDTTPVEPADTTEQVSAPATVAGPAVVSAPDTFDDDAGSGDVPARQQPAIGELGTGTTEIDGYFAGATSTFTKTNTRLIDIPSSINVVTEEQFEDQGHEGLGQVLQWVPGVTVQQGEGHRDQITIRGQETNADFFTDGVRDDIQYYRDLYNIEAVEVLKGPAAMVFGRGGGGGIVNRVTKKAEWRDIQEGSINFGMYERKRATIDVGGAASSSFAFRLNAMYEDSDSFRDFFELERYGINPTIAVKLSPHTVFRASYEYYTDDRTVDRGVPSVAATAEPLKGFRDTFFGNPNVSFSDYEGHIATATLEHEFASGLQVRQHISYNHYDKFYQNIMPGSSVNGAGFFEIGEIGGGDDGGYNSDTDRESFFSQTDFAYQFNTGDLVRHSLTAGTEFTWQDQRNTRFIPTFAGGVGGLLINVDNATNFTPVTFPTQTRDRNVDLQTQSYYIQDQVEITKYFEIIAGVRYDRFDLEFFNALNGDRFDRVDKEWSPRVGAVIKPTRDLSFYASWSRSFLPSAGDQFDNLTEESAEFEPQEFENREIGFKWAMHPRLILAGALYELDRTNQPVTVSGVTVTSGETETRGGEVSLTGYVTDAWQIAMGYAYTDSEITNSGDNTDLRGNSVESVPLNHFSLWNRYQFSDMFGAGIGVLHQDDFFPTASNTVTVPGFTRVDSAVYFDFNENWSAQVNVENLFNIDYFASAHNNNNISPGAPTSVFGTVRAKF